MRTKLLCIGLLLLVVGCSSLTETTTICEYTDEFGDYYYDEMVAKGDKVTYNVMISDIDYSEMLDSGDLTLEEVEDYYESYHNTYNTVTGVGYDYKANGTKYKDELIVDYDKVSAESIRLLDLADLEDDNFISLELSVKSLEETGYNCTVKE